MIDKKYIIVDEDNRPMAWDARGEQLAYVDIFRYGRFHLRVYTKNEAKKLIRTTIENRKKWRLNDDDREYNLMRVDL